MDTKPALKICAECTYFAEVPFLEGTTLVCTAKEPTIDVITGVETYFDCGTIRRNLCNGAWYKQKVSRKESLTKRFRRVIARFSLKD